MIERDGAEDVESTKPTSGSTKDKGTKSSDTQSARPVEMYFTQRVYLSSTVTILKPIRKEENESP